MKQSRSESVPGVGMLPYLHAFSILPATTAEGEELGVDKEAAPNPHQGNTNEL